MEPSSHDFQKYKKEGVVYYEDLDAEAIHRFYVEDFPAIVVIDSEGNNLYETKPQKYRIQ
nr:fumarate hydratase C-terminal domain-containing protein [Tepidanaerobacter acetatoxydans]